MQDIFDFSGIDKNEKAIKKTWEEFKDDLAQGKFCYDEVAKAKESCFLRTYYDLFHKHSGIDFQTKLLRDLTDFKLGRGTRLDEKEVPDYERFIPKKEFIKEENRFSPKGIEWLYLAIGTETDIHECAKVECRMKNGEKFGFCHFEINNTYLDGKIVDLTIADDVTYEEINKELEMYGRSQMRKMKKAFRDLGIAPHFDRSKFNEVMRKWGVYTHTKLLSEQIFVPLETGVEYFPFQTMAQYYISLGYVGIVYGSTVSKVGKNIVLFDKNIGLPVGNIETMSIK